MKDVINYGDVGDKFYIIFKGIVSVFIPNPSIKEWFTKRKHFLKLLKWKEEIFEIKVK